jgi:hypothetical protein
VILKNVMKNRLLAVFFGTVAIAGQADLTGQ